MTCNGAVNCHVAAEDEDFELCQYTFPEGALVYCKETNRSHYDIFIYAVPCDGIVGELQLIHLISPQTKFDLVVNV